MRGRKVAFVVLHSKEKDISVGDQVITHNKCLGTVVRLGKDNFGEYIIVKLNFLDWEFAYDPWELKKV